MDIKETLKQLHRRQDELQNAIEKAGGEDVLLNTISDIGDRSSSMWSNDRHKMLNIGEDIEPQKEFKMNWPNSVIRQFTGRKCYYRSFLQSK